MSDTGKFKVIQEKVIAGQRVSGEEVTWLVGEVGSGRITDAQMGGLMAGLFIQYNKGRR